MLMKKAHPQPPQPTPLTVLMKRALPQPPLPTSSTDSSNNADEKSTASNVPIAAFESSNLISSNSTTTDDLGKNNQTDFDQVKLVNHTSLLNREFLVDQVIQSNLN